MIYLLVAILLVALAVLGILNLALSRKHALSASDIDEIRKHWQGIEGLMRDSHDAAWVKAVMEADKLLDLVLTKKRVPGGNLGAKLKNARHLFQNVQAVWEAHKFRNQLAHEFDVHVSRGQVERVIGLFRQALRELKAI